MEKNKAHILIVDDDNRIRDLLKEYLNENEYIVSTSENAENAKIKLTHFKFDLIVLDVMMPGQSGYDLTRELKKNIEIPIILLTAKGEVENRIKGLELGADDYISKPFEPKELLLRIKNIINKNNKTHILVVDDDNRIRDLLKEYLTEKDYIVSTSDDAENAKIKITQFKFDLIVLDVMMPGQNGYELTKEIKKSMKVPIILLTAKGEVENRIKGLELGADDYIGKPFEPKELLLRIKNLTNKNKKIDLNIKHFVGNAQIDLNKMNIILEEKNKKINISEKKVLVEMLANPGKTYSREEIGKISGISQERSIDVMITRLRQKIEINPKNPKYLQTIRGSGYVLWIE